VPKILIIDEHGALRHGLRCLIEQRITDADVCEATHILEMPSLARREKSFDLVLIDADALDGHTRASLERTYDVPAKTRVAIISVAHSREEVLSCLATGYYGLIDKSQLDDGIISALNDILDGRVHVPAWIADGAEKHPEIQALSGTPHPLLTPRQRSVLSLVAEGLSNKQIAYRLQISEGTAKIHTAALLRALGVRNRAEAAAKAAAQLGWFPHVHQSPTLAPKAALSQAPTLAPKAALNRAPSLLRRRN
jgi:DNA-binding NarL/FixJ family response regulator